MHPAEVGRLFEGCQQLTYMETIDPIGPISVRAPSCVGGGAVSYHAERGHPRRRRNRIGGRDPAILSTGRSAVPVERMLEDDELVIAEGLLLGGDDVDVEIEVLFVQILKCHTRQISYRIDESSIDP